MFGSDNFQLKKAIILRTVPRFDRLLLKILQEINCSDPIVIVIDKSRVTEFDLNVKIEINQFDIDVFKSQYTKSDYVVLIDNYFSSSELNCLKIFSEYQIFLINYGIYLCKDEVSMAFPKFRSYFKFGIAYNYLKIKFKSYYQGLRYFKKLVDVREFVYTSNSIIFWNCTSQKNFLNDYPFATTLNIGLYEKSLLTQSDKSMCHNVLLAPSVLGHNSSVFLNELFYWIDICYVLRATGIENIVLSIHPMYKDNLKFILSYSNFSDVVCGVSMDELEEFDLVLTDTSTLFWLAPVFGARSQMVNGYEIPVKYGRNKH